MTETDTRAHVSPRILAVDPGTSQSGVVVLQAGRVLQAGVYPNADVLSLLATTEADLLAVERFEARGMAIGDESVVTMIWTGRFVQAWRAPDAVVLVKRSRVKSHLCGTQRAKDANIRQALIDLLGAPGTKKAPGATYSVSSHAWAALAVAVTAEALLP